MPAETATSNGAADHYLGRTVVDLVPAEQAGVLVPCCRAALAGRRRYVETPGWRGPGEYWAVAVVPLHGEGGAVIGGVAFWRDITKRHRAEEALRQHRRQLRQQIRDELAALRRTIATLRPLVLDQRGLAAAVAELAAATRDRAGLDACEVAVDLDGPALDPVVETALFRVAQQALANVEQHANARRLRVALDRDRAQVVLVVQDDGRGFDPAHAQPAADTHGFGLTCMRERLQAIGGRFTLCSAPGAGTRIQAQAAAPAPA